MALGGAAVGPVLGAGALFLRHFTDYFDWSFVGWVAVSVCGEFAKRKIIPVRRRCRVAPFPSTQLSTTQQKIYL